MVSILHVVSCAATEMSNSRLRGASARSNERSRSIARAQRGVDAVPSFCKERPASPRESPPTLRAPKHHRLYEDATGSSRFDSSTACHVVATHGLHTGQPAVCGLDKLSHIRLRQSSRDGTNVKGCHLQSLVSIMVVGTNIQPWSIRADIPCPPCRVTVDTSRFSTRFCTTAESGTPFSVVAEFVFHGRSRF